jgi:MerR family transcriptional regulator, redox-sensitive transcriptional activator SoxR
MSSLSIGEVVRRTGKSASTIRYYEDIGLLPAPERASGRRRYAAEIVRTLSIVDTAQRAGLSLDEIRLLLDPSPAEQLRDVARRKLPELTEAIARAELVRVWLEDAARCHCPTLDDCPLFDEAPLPALHAELTQKPAGRRALST